MGKRHAYLGQMKGMMPYGITGLERVKAAVYFYSVWLQSPSTCMSITWHFKQHTEKPAVVDWPTLMCYYKYNNNNNNNNNNWDFLRLCPVLLSFQSTGFERSICWNLHQGILK